MNNFCKILVFLILTSVVGCSVFYQSTSPQFNDSNLSPQKGKYVTSKGKLRILLVYAMFSDDEDKKSKGWKFSKTELPSWAHRMINISPEIFFPNENLTQYFYEMSYGNLMLYGDVYPEVVIPKYKQDKYKSIAEVNHEILAKIDKDIDFSQYDNWSKDKDRNYVNHPDGKVDMIFVIYRNFKNKLYFKNGWTGIAHLHLKDDIKTNDGVLIAKGRLDKGSGLSSRGGKNGFAYMKYVLAHEFGHFLFGAGHIENTTNLALMTGGPVWNASRGMHSWEKNRLGWMEFKDVPLNKNSIVKVRDYHTTGDVVRIKLSKSEWYLIENHQKLSPNDWAKDKGIYIFHVKNPRRFSPTIDIKCAEGNWDFKVDANNQKLSKVVPNPKGKSEYNFRKRVDKKDYACYKGVYGDKSAWGDEFDAFDLEYNNLFSPFSNPPMISQSGKEFALLVKNQIDDEIEVEILFNDIYKKTPPSKSQILGISKKNNRYILSWLENKEPDLRKYNIYIAPTLSKKFKLFKSVNRNASSLDIAQALKNKKSAIVYITAIDKSLKESIPSDYFELQNDLRRNKWNWKRVESYQ